jgi:hypothetical protein
LSVEREVRSTAAPTTLLRQLQQKTRTPARICQGRQRTLEEDEMGASPTTSPRSHNGTARLSALSLQHVAATHPTKLNKKQEQQPKFVNGDDGLLKKKKERH